MNTTLLKRYGQIETDRKNLFAELKSYSDETLNKKPAPEAWSVAEVIAHLISAEEGSLKYLQKKLLDTSKAEREGLKHKWRWLLVNIVFAFHIKFKAPKIVEPQPGYYNLADLESKWAGIRSEIHNILEKLPDSEAQKDIWKHAVAGKLNVYRMVQFFGIHAKRHKGQIDRTLKIVTRN